MTLLTAVLLIGGTVNVATDHMQIVFERKGSHVEVQQSFQLRAVGDDGAQPVDGHQVMLPAGAYGPRQVGEEKNDLELKSDRFAVKLPITKEGRNVSIRYNLPIQSGKVTLEQSIGGSIGTARVISTWTAGETNLAGQGFGKSEQQQLTDGLFGLVIMARDIQDGHVSITLSGLDAGMVEWQALITLVLSIFLLASGLAIWFKDKLSGHDEDPAKSA